MTLRKWGAFAAPILALLYVAGIVLSTTLLNTTGIVDPVERTRFQVQNQGAMSAFILSLYVLFGCLVPVVALAACDRFSGSAPGMTRIATVFALIWSTLLIASGLVFHVGLGAVAELFPRDPSGATALMRIVEVVHEGLGCTAEIPGGLWMLCLSLPALRTRAMHPGHAWTGIVAGASGILSVVPALFVPAVGVYVLTSLVWFTWMGIRLHHPPSLPL
ncbi:MAG: hypothetical protein RL318_2944 [Fibrobacterota bacterium]|jgi:hypothetical protein